MTNKPPPICGAAELRFAEIYALLHDYRRRLDDLQQLVDKLHALLGETAQKPS